MKKTIEIPEGYEARIESNKVILEPKESEGEKIRKALISILKSDFDGDTIIYGTSVSDIIAWLEKQGEQNLTNSYCQKNCKGFQETGKCFADGECKAKREAEQKSTDKVEPKFKVGDWIVSHYNHIAQIKSIDEKNYFLSCNDGNSERLSIDCINRNWHLWTIQDAKDGDILVMIKDKAPFIFKGFLDKFHPDCPVAYGGIVRNGTFDVSSGDGWWDEGQICPATKEQRDFLFQKMEEAGYEWDSEKKEFREVEQEPTAWSEDDEETLNSIINDLSQNVIPDEGDIQWLKSFKERYTWIPSDEQMKALEDAKMRMSLDGYGLCPLLQTLINDLKKLKG